MIKNFINNLYIVIKIMIFILLPLVVGATLGLILIGLLISNPIWQVVGLIIFFILLLTAFITYIEWIFNTNIF